MNKLDAFRLGVENLKELYRNSEKAAEYMSDPNNWVLVHVTQYMPRQNKNGQRYIPTTAMVRDFDFPRSTVHFTLNRVVHSHMMGNWDGKGIVILAPYSDAIKQNQNPAELASEDTYFSPNPDTGFVLPESVHIVQPGANIPDGQLFVIDGNVTKYKNDNFSESEIKTILSLLDENMRDEYLQFETGEWKDYELETEMGKWDKQIKKAYGDAADKKAFLRGMFEEERYQILSKFVRDIAVQQTMQNMGYTKVSGHEDSSTRAVADAAFKMGVLGFSGDKGHEASLYNSIEDVYVSIVYLLDELANAKNANEFYDLCEERIRNPVYNEIIRAIAYDDKLDINMLCNRAFASKLKDVERSLGNDLNPDERKFKENYIKAKSIADVDKNLDTTIKRWSEKQQANFSKFKDKLKSMPYYAELVGPLKTLVTFEQMRIENRQAERD